MKYNLSKRGSSHLGERGKHRKPKAMSNSQLKTLRDINMKIDMCDELIKDYLKRKEQLIQERENWLKNRLI